MGVSSMLLVLAFLLIGLIMIWYVLQLRELHMMKNVLLDGLNLTNLASPVSDEEVMQKVEFGWYHYDPATGQYVLRPTEAVKLSLILENDKTYQNFMELVEANLEEERNVVSNHQGDSRIRDWSLEKFIVYNVTEANTEISIYDGTGLQSRELHENNLGLCVAPNGRIVTKTSVYSRITFTYRDLLGRDHENLGIEQLTAVRAVY